MGEHPASASQELPTGQFPVEQPLLEELPSRHVPSAPRAPVTARIPNAGASRWVAGVALAVAGGGLAADAAPLGQLLLAGLLAAQAVLYASLPVFLNPERQLTISYVFLVLAALWLPLPTVLGIALLTAVAVTSQRGLGGPMAQRTWVSMAVTTAGLGAGFAAHGALVPHMPGWFVHLAFVVAMLGFSAFELAGVVAADAEEGSRRAWRAWRVNYVDAFLRYLLMTTAAMAAAMLVDPGDPLAAWPVWVGIALVYAPFYQHGLARRNSFDMVCSWGRAVDAKDTYTLDHTERVARVALAIGRDMGLSERRLDQLVIAARLHDIGKILVRDEVLKKPGSLTAEEYDHIKEHARWGGEILEQMRAMRALARVVRHHHERWDGGGYPDGVSGRQIPVEAAIIAVADAYDAMTSARAYRPAMDDDEAVRRIREGAGRQFHPQVVAHFLAVHGRGLESTPSPFAFCAIH